MFDENGSNRVQGSPSGNVSVTVNYVNGIATALVTATTPYYTYGILNTTFVSDNDTFGGTFVCAGWISFACD